MKQRIRPSWDEYWLQIAKDVAQRGTCLRRCYGAVIVDTQGRLVSTGYCGSPRGAINCCDVGVCERKKLNIPSGQRYELCKSVHAEVNAISFASPERIKDGTIYISGFDVETNKVTIISRDGKMIGLPLLAKREVAEKILDEVVELLL